MTISGHPPGTLLTLAAFKNGSFRRMYSTVSRRLALAVRLGPAPVAAVALLLGASSPARCQSAPSLYQQALRTQQVQGDLEAAIALFQRVVAAGDRELAARALLHIGRSYELLGRPAEASYRRVLLDYADQSGPAAQARSRLSALGRPNEPNPAAVTLRLVAAGEDLDRYGQVSPDGRLLTGVGGAMQGGKSYNAPAADLVIYDLSSGSRRRVTRKAGPLESAGGSIWSPDGTRIALAWTIDFHRMELRSIEVDSGAMTTLLGDPAVVDLYPAAWSDDGRQVLAAVKRNDGGTQLILVPVDGGAPQVLVSLRDPPYEPRAGFSPGQGWIGYSARSQRQQGDHDLYAISRNGARTAALMDHTADDRFLGWTQRGILFTSDRRGTIDVFLLPMSDERPAGAPLLLKVGVGRISPAGFDRRGTFYYHAHVDASEIHMVGVDPSTWRTAGEPTLEIGPVEGKSQLPDWSPDGEYFGYVSRIGAAETPTIVVRRDATGEERQVTLPLGAQPYSLRIAPGGRRALVARYYTDDVELVDVAAGTFQPLALARVAPDAGAVNSSWTSSFTWSADGRRIFYATLGGARALMVREVATGEDRELYRATGQGAVLSPAVSHNGRLLAFGVMEGPLGSSALVVLPAAGSAAPPRELVRRDRGRLWPLAFTPDDRHLIYATRRWPPDSPLVVLSRIPVGGGEPELLDLPAELGAMGFRPDGRRMAFVRDRSLAELWALDEFARPRPR